MESGKRRKKKRGQNKNHLNFTTATQKEKRKKWWWWFLGGGAGVDRCATRAGEVNGRGDKQGGKNVRRKSVFRWDPGGEKSI